LAGAVSANQVGAPNVADEEGVAGERQPGLFGAGGVADQQGDAFRGVPGCVADFQANIAQPEHIAVFERLVGELSAGVFVNEDGRPCAFCQVAVARNVIGMQVGLEDVGDAQAALGGGVQVLLHVAVRVNHRSHAVRLAADDVGGAAQPLDKKLL
jgi:hypothetical protein